MRPVTVSVPVLRASSALLLLEVDLDAALGLDEVHELAQVEPVAPTRVRAEVPLVGQVVEELLDECKRRGVVHGPWPPWFEMPGFLIGDSRP